MNRAILIILDGFGISPRQEGNAVLAASTPMLNAIFSQFPPLLLQASGEAVGLPFGEMGNSEVGHLTLGTGRVIIQDFTQINNAIANKSFFKKKAFTEVIEHIKRNNSSLHLVGILTDSAVHGSLEHLMALIDLAKQNSLQRVFIHLFTDGRDTPPKSAQVFIDRLEKKLAEVQIGKIATLCGRYYGMDRDKNQDRTQKAYNLITQLKGQKYSTAKQALEANYQAGKTDENLEPAVIENGKGLSDNDGLIIFNFRADRAIQISQALTADSKSKNLKAAIFVEYDYNVKAQVAFTAVDLNNPQINPLVHSLSDIVSQAKLNQLHAAETEKYAHVTFFFNASKRKKHRGEDWLLVPSLKGTADISGF
jgi:2,3-bisphosphoglycerate-independent phosphoglycerate mutase